MKEPDKDKYKDAMKSKIEDLKNGNFTVIRKTDMPEGATLVPSVWQMKRTRCLSTGVVKKYKARLNADGSGRSKVKITIIPMPPWHRGRPSECC